MADAWISDETEGKEVDFRGILNKFGCPQKQPPSRDSPRSYEHWAAEQKEQHAYTHEKCMRPWSKHACPEELA